MIDFIAFASALMQNDDAGLIASIVGSTVSCVCGGAVFLIVVIGLWKVFEKADEPGWAAIIPIYNYYILLKIVGRPWWWLLLLLIPFVNFVISIIVAIDMAKSFGKDAVYGIILLWLFSVIGFLILGFGDAQYLGPAAAQKT
jgi:hypothetical protein